MHVELATVLRQAVTRRAMSSASRRACVTITPCATPFRTGICGAQRPLILSSCVRRLGEAEGHPTYGLAILKNRSNLMIEQVVSLANYLPGF